MNDKEKLIEKLRDVQFHFEARAKMTIFDERRLLESWAQAQKEAIKALKTQQEWISVKDKVPRDYEPVLVYSMVDGRVAARYIAPWKWRAFDGCPVHEVTHWMPFPKPPEKE